MKTYSSFVLSLVLCLFTGCSDTNVSADKTQPEKDPSRSSPQPSAKPNPTYATVKLGNVQRKYKAEENTSCVFNETFGEAIVIFSNEPSGAGLSIRFQGVTKEKSTRDLVAKNDGENIFVVLGGDYLKNNYQMARDDDGGNCSVTTEVVGDYLYGSFDCKKLINREGNVQTASSSWICKTQTSQDWSW